MIAYKYRSGKGTKDSEGNDVFKRDIDLLSQDKIYIPTVAQLNDPAEAFVDDRAFNFQLQLLKTFGAKNDDIQSVKNRLISFKERILSSGIYSLSKKNDNELMWSYYASGHCGYAIMFDTEVLANSFDQGKWGGMYKLDMKYSSKLPQFDISKITKGDINNSKTKAGKICGIISIALNVVVIVIYLIAIAAGVSTRYY